MYFSSAMYQKKKADKMQQDHASYSQLQTTVENAMGQADSLTQSEQAQFQTLPSTSP